MLEEPASGVLFGSVGAEVVFPLWEIEILRGLASSETGIVSVRTPSLKSATMRSTAIRLPSVS